MKARDFDSGFESGGASYLRFSPAAAIRAPDYSPDHPAEPAF